MLKKGKICFKCLNGVFEDRVSIKYNSLIKKKDRKLFKRLNLMVKSVVYENVFCIVNMG